ncbi:MAG: ADP-ribosylglycohydrolase family protein [Pleomorphochaeta sp.]
MKFNLEELIDKTYAGFLAMNIGIRLGAPVEPTVWTSDRIQRAYGTITDYVKNFKNFAADDDVNGPVYFLRSLDDSDYRKGLTKEAVGQAWLNYAREEIGMFWWGGYGVSTEHTAYLNLKNGISPNKSGSIEVNGKTRAEQIGGQIFIDTWGFIWPGNPKKASEYAKIAASISHDGEGLNGAAFIAACIAEAYNTSDIKEIINEGLKYIPKTSIYAKVVNSVIKFHKTKSDNWRDCLLYLQENWGYDKYKGVCHIIPNAGVCIMAMLYAKDVNEALEIATMAGWDTDCNAGNVGSILGVSNGLDKIRENYRKPINDFIVLSGISGYLNTLDIPSYVKYLVSWAYKLNNEEVPTLCKTVDGEINFDFELPGSTHGFRVSNLNQTKIKHSTEFAHSGKGSLRITYDRMKRGEKSRIYYKNFYRREDFDDERYSPAFSPTAYSGQTVSMYIFSDKFSGASDFIVVPYVRNSTTKEIVYDKGITLSEKTWTKIEFTIPDLDGAVCDEIGISLESNSRIRAYDYGFLYLDDFCIKGKANYKIEMDKQTPEFRTITPFTINHGAWDIEDNYLNVMCLNHGEALVGNYFTKEVEISNSLKIESGNCGLLALRVQGAQRGYYGGFYKDQLVIGKTVNGKFEIINSKDFIITKDTKYSLKFKIENNNLSLYLDNNLELTCEDDLYKYGMVGLSMQDGGRTSFNTLSIKEL